MNLTENLMTKCSNKGDADSYHIVGNYMLIYNRGLDYAGIDFFMIEDNILYVYNYFFTSKVTEELEENFWDMSDSEKLLYLQSLIPWSFGECEYKTYTEGEIETI